MDKINNQFFRDEHFTLGVSSKLTSGNGRVYGGFKVDGKITFTYYPYKDLYIKDTKQNKLIYIPLDYYDMFDDGMRIAYKALYEEDIFYKDSLGVLISNTEKIKKYTTRIKARFFNISIKPSMGDCEGISYEGVHIIQGENIIFLPHKTAKRIIKILNKTDVFLLAEMAITNAILLSGGNK
jgi:hypothetical protein